MSRIGALAAGGLATFLGAGAVSIFTSGNAGLLVIVGGVMAAGSIGLFMLALSLFFREPPSEALRGRRRVRPLPSTLSPGQRLAYVAIGVLMMVMATHALVTGTQDQVRGPVVTRQDKPGQFWMLVLMYAGVGGFLLHRGLRRPPGDPDRSPRRDADDDR